MTVETHDVAFSFDQPRDARHPLLSTLQQLLNRPLEKDSRATALLGSRRVLIVDSQRERAQYLAQLLASAGYRPFVAPTSLDAYTLFLQGTFHPFAIILSEDGVANNQFFLTRLSQQFEQRYDWKIPFIRLQMPPPLFGPRATEPLAGGQRPVSPSTSPLNPPSGVLTGPSRVQPVSPVAGPRSPAFPSAGQPVRMPPQQPPVSPYPPAQTGSPASVHPSSGSLRPSAPVSSPPPTPSPESPVPRGISLHGQNRQRVPLPSASIMKFTKKQFEKISLDGLSIGRYQLQTLIGGNPIGDVYLTYDRLREQDIALKTIQTNMIPFHLMEGLEEDYNLFQQEFDLLQQLDHPHLSRVMNIGRSYISGFPFIYKTMPYYEHGSLASWLAQFPGRLFAPSEVARLIWQVADAIQFLHTRGLLYQNFKMTNILVTNETQNLGELQVVLADLPFVQDVVNLPKTLESYRYFAPEQWENEAFTSSDQYGLAVLAYELLVGRAPFQGNSASIMQRMHLTRPAPAPSSFNRYIYPFIDKVILRALSKRPAERFDSVSAFAAALERACN
ncbi:MAG TPA: protein kinase [Ktedonobacteraceae bacterium]|nr:protein kinase [Ktedonobacteraceae bacterium]